MWSGPAAQQLSSPAAQRLSSSAARRAGPRFEQKDYEKCIETCKKGVEVGREVKADFKIVAKSYARIGNAYIKQARVGRLARV